MRSHHLERSEYRSLELLMRNGLDGWEVSVAKMT